MMFLLVVLIPTPAQTQARVSPRDRPKAFPIAVSLGVALGFHGTRAEERASNLINCDPCTLGYGPSNSPHANVRIEAPLTAGTAIRAGIDIARSRQRLDRDGTKIGTTNTSSTIVRGEAVFLFRLKPGVPVYFGVGGTYGRLDPSPVVGQAPPVFEPGGVLLIGYDATISEQWGFRTEFANHVLKPDDGGLPSNRTANTWTRDWSLGFGLRYKLTR